MAVTTEPDRTVTTLMPRRRRRWWLAIIVVVLVVGAGTYGGLIAYEPLREGSYWSARGPSNIEAQKGVNEQADVVAYESGTELIVEFTIRNEGLVGITVTDVDPPVSPESLGLYRVTEIRRGTEQCCGETEAFAPFTLAPDEERFVQFRGTLKGCGDYVPGSSMAWSSYTVAYRILGVPRTTEIPTRRPVIIEIPATYTCTEPPTYPRS